MRTAWLCALMLLIHCTNCVIVQDGDFTFSLEEVLKLKEVLDQKSVPESRVKREISQSAVQQACANPELPRAFLPVCANPDAQGVFYRLERIASEPDVCDVCAFAACSGC
ncbi:hypothetical protein XENTR_v10013052 [Xenopus tropicalis]|uniref:Guanylate cyclase activator 2B n=1 Tax=Xenopus tropicalis TaxID=8364 RepID=A0A803JU38_XENTR|nr:guanylin-like [Xenopus tropicalis]KAE8600075.1 hypothetical protein XENTR_v10013052 [Xenopus tropicalis]